MQKLYHRRFSGLPFFMVKLLFKTAKFLSKNAKKPIKKKLIKFTKTLFARLALFPNYPFSLRRLANDF